MKTIVFFNQAAGDIVHILKIYDQLMSSSTDYTFKIVCFNNERICEVYRTLHLNNVDVSFFSHIYPSFKNLFSRRQWRKKVFMALEKIITDRNTEIYFTSIYDDFMTPYYVGILAEKGHRIYYLNHYDDCQNIFPTKNSPLKKRLILRILNYNTGIRYSMCNMSGRWIVFRYPKEIIPHMTELHPVLDSVICKKYAVKIDSNVNKTALLFTQPNRDHQLISNEEHDEIQRSVAKKLKDAGYTLVLKGHPTIGICEAVRPYADVIVPQIIPGELLDFSQVHSCYAFLSIALASTAKLGICSYSFLPLMKSHESVNYQEALSFITEIGEGKILLLNSLNEID